MRAILVTPGVRGNLRLGEIDEPIADSDETLVRVQAVSVNRGEVKRAETAAQGSTIGWDLAGIVEAAARDGSGPQVGQRVVGFSPQMRAWAELVAVDSAALAIVPNAVSLAHAATLPVAGLTALYGLERANRLLGAKVLVTGASGGVGYFACQLARLMGARVTAQVRRAEHVAMVQATGVESVVVDSNGEGLADYAPFRLVLDGVALRQPRPHLRVALALVRQSHRGHLSSTHNGQTAN